MAIIAHFDLDAFFASCETVRRPALDGTPVVICMYSGRGEDGGAVSTCNYAARDLGIHAGMPITQAKDHAAETDKEATFLQADKEYYKAVSERIMDVIRDYAADVEQASIDEAYADLSPCDTLQDAVDTVKAVKADIREQEEVTASAGVAANRFMAKMASDFEKPDGLTVVSPGTEEQFLADMPVDELHGVGPKTAETLREQEVETVDDLQDVPVQQLVRLFGEKQGVSLHEKAVGQGKKELEQQEKQQLSRLTTMEHDTRSMSDLRPVIRDLSRDVIDRVRDRDVYYTRVAALIVTTDVSMRTRGMSLNAPTDDMETLFRTAEDLAKQFLDEHPDIHVRRIGVRVSGFESANQKTLDAF